MRIVFFCLVHLFVCTTQAEKLIWTDSSGSVLVGKYLEYLPADRNSRIQDVMHRTDWKKGKVDVLNFGSTAKAYWLRITIENRSKEKKLYLEVNMPYLDHFEFFDSIDFNVENSVIIGDTYPFEFRMVPETLPVQILQIDSVRNYVMKIYSDQSIVLPIKVKSEKAYDKSYKIRITFFGIFTGVLSIIFVSSILVYFTLGESMYSAYAIYIFTAYFTQSIATSQLYEYLLTTDILVARHALTISTTLLGIAALEFVKRFLNVRSFSLGWFKTMGCFQVSFLLQPILVLIGSPVGAFAYVNVVFLLSSLLVAITAVLAFRNYVDLASFFLVAWITFIVGSIMYTLNNLGLISYSYIVNYTMPVGVAIETVTLTLALAVRIRSLTGSRDNISTFVNIREQIIIREKKLNDRIETEEFNISLLDSHMVANILNFAHSKISNDDVVGTKRLLEETSVLLREGLRILKKGRTSVDEEIGYFKLMTNVARLRYEGRIKLEVKVDPRINMYREGLVPLLLQPFVENSLKYGFTAKRKRLDLLLSYKMVDRNSIKVIWEDSGPGLLVKYGNKTRISYGMEITKSRINALARRGFKVSLEIKNKIDFPEFRGSSGVFVSMIIPMN